MVTKSPRIPYETPRIPEEDPNIFYPEDDDEPMADNDWQRRAIVDTSETLIQHFADRPDVYVSADMFVYYEMDNANRHVSPDVFVVLGVSDHSRRSYFIWRDGKPPDLVLEVACPSTYERDANEKRDIYAAMGVREYWRFDPNDGLFFWPPLIGERLNDQGRYEELPLVRSDGILRCFSETLGLEFCVVNEQLKLYDPASQTWLRNLSEENAARRTAEEQSQAAEERADSAEERAQSAEEHARALEQMLREHGITPP